MQISQYLQDKIAKWLDGTNLPAVPASLELALSSTDPVTGITEVGTRQAVTFNAASGRSMSNNNAIVWTPVSGTIAYVALFDDSGNMLMSGPLAVPVVVPSGGTFSFASGDVTLSFGSNFGETFANNILDWMRGNAMPSAPTTAYIEVSRGATFNPPATTDGYAKQELVFDTFTYAAGVGTTIENGEDITFPVAHTNPWGSVTHVVITDGTNVLFNLELTTPKYVSIGESIGFANNSISCLLN
jgi:hypothetical protein